MWKRNHLRGGKMRAAGVWPSAPKVAPRDGLRSEALVALAVLSAIACAPKGTGGLTAQIVIADDARTPRELRGVSLRTSSLNAAIEKLAIEAHDADGNILARTVLSTAPNIAEGENALSPTGGEWELGGVPAGTGRVLVARAYLGARSDPRISEALAYEGRRANIRVEANTTTDIGVLELARSDVQIPELDFDPPEPPNPITLTRVPEGEALDVSYTTQPGTSGILVAVAEGTPEVLGLRVQDLPIDRQSVHTAGDLLDTGFTVVSVVPSGESGPPRVTGLQDNVTYRVLVYAFDTDLDGMPLNYSTPASGWETPRDIVAPGSVDLLSGQASATTGLVTIRFVSPGEDDRSGTPARYDVRAATGEINPEDSQAFGNLGALMPPTPRPAGEEVVFEASVAELGLPAAGPFHIAVRAVDGSGNLGPITTADVAEVESTPAIHRIEPGVLVAGESVIISGLNFGASQGTVTVTAARPPNSIYALTVNSWNDARIVADVPNTAEGGLLTLTRTGASGAQNATVSVSLVARFDGPLSECNAAGGSCEAPFELLGTPDTNGDAISVLHRDRDDNGPYQIAIDRFVGSVRDATSYSDFSSETRTAAVGGAYSATFDRFAFAAASGVAGDGVSMAFITGDGTPNASRHPRRTTEGHNADSVALVIPNGGNPATIPGLLAYSQGGTIHTAFVPDLEDDAFSTFYEVARGTDDSDSHVRMAHRSSDNAVLMAFKRSTNGGPGRLELWMNDDGSDAQGFERVDAERSGRPEIGDGLEVLVTSDGSDERFAIVYDAIEAGGSKRIRVLFVDAYGVQRGYAPLPDGSGDQRLEDAGITLRDGTQRLVILGSRISAQDMQLHYMEVPFDLIAIGDTSTAPAEAAVLETFDLPSQDTRLRVRGRVGCKPFGMEVCPMAWLGPSVRTMFIRR